MRPSDYLADTIADEGKRWAALAGLDAPLPEVAKNGNLWGSVALGLGLAAIGAAFVLGPEYIQVLILLGPVGGIVATVVEMWSVTIGAEWTN